MSNEKSHYFILGLIFLAAAAIRLGPDEKPSPDDNPILDFLKRRLAKVKRVG